MSGTIRRNLYSRLWPQLVKRDFGKWFSPHDSADRNAQRVDAWYTPVLLLDVCFFANGRPLIEDAVFVSLGLSFMVS